MKGTPVLVLCFLSILALTIIGALSLSPAYACASGSHSATLSSSTITQGTPSVTVTGTDTCDPPGTAVEVVIEATCPGSALTPAVMATTSGSPLGFTAKIDTSSVPVGGPYCLSVTFGHPVSSFFNECCALTVVPALPPPALKETDWAIVDVGITPKHPQPGDTVTLGAVLVALSSTVSFPQSVVVGCTIDGIPCGSGVILYPGPTGTPYIVTAQTHWVATPGTHTLTWSVSTKNDPNPSNNVKTIIFTVAPTIQTTTAQTTTQPISTSTQPVADFTIGTTPSSQTVLQGQTVSYSVNLTALNGFNSLVSLSVSGLPSGASGVFSNPSGTPDFTSTLTVTLPGNVLTGSYTLTVTGSGGGITHNTNLALTVNAAITTQASTSSSSTEASSSLMSMIEQNQLLILGAVVLLAAVVIAVALLSRRKPAPTQPTSTGAATGMVYCAKCGTQNPPANSFCAKCGTKL